MKGTCSNCREKSVEIKPKKIDGKVMEVCEECFMGAVITYTEQKKKKELKDLTLAIK
jgi:hypothetical protein